MTHEIWQHRDSREYWAVELSGGRVVRCCGPLGADDLDPQILEYLPYDTADVAWVDVRREDFVRHRLARPA